MLISSSQLRIVLTRNIQNFEKVIIKSEGKNYADILKSVKNSVNIGEVGIRVKGLKRTMKGDVMLEIHGEKDKANTLKQKTIKENEDARVEIINKIGTVYVSGIEQGCSTSHQE
ncbi:hypothetical protein QE152_g150 [Popillia japonica]|uniref:Uncharacterized protein n=1 Tax=Popillia japonica TaxID=7064 RepID=A0AAW1NL07_POPJA